MSRPVIIEAAISGGPSCRHGPRDPADIAEDALSCLAAGASIIHNHIEDIRLTGAPAAARYREGWRPILERRPDAILCPTTSIGDDAGIANAHQEMLADLASMGVLDPGSVNLASSTADGLPGERRIVYANGFDAIETTMALLERARLGPSIAIYEPGWLRAVLAYHRAGRLPPGTMVKLYFGGERNWMNGVKGGIGFGLPPTPTALDAYLEMLSGVDLPWAVAVPGGDVVATGLARLAVERGGHIRVGLEDHADDDTPSNRDLVTEAADLVRALGCSPASTGETSAILRLPRRMAAA